MTRGFTLIELLIVLAIIGVVAGLGALGLINLMYANTVEQTGQSVAQQFALAKNAARRNNTDATVTVSTATKVVTVRQGTTVLSQETFAGAALSVTCRSTCPTGNVFTLRAPFGTLAEDVKITAQRGTHTRSAYILGPVMVVVRR